MKKQPIDELFAKKLTNWEPKASSDLWAKIEARQEKKPRRLGGWFWSIAASVTLLLMTGYLLWQNQPTIPTGSGTGVAQTEIKTSESALPELQPDAAMPEVALSEEAPAPKTKPERSITTVSERDAIAKKTIEPTEKPTGQTRPQVREQIEIAAIERLTYEPEKLVDRDTEPSLAQTLEVVAVVPEANTAPDKRVIRANVDWDEPVKEEDRKNSRFAKIMQQLKNAKQGEAVDWQEVGFNPKKILARADEKIRNEEYKASKKYQEFKDKTKL